MLNEKNQIHLFIPGILNIPLVEALGLSAPEQKELIISPDSMNFKIYYEYIEEKINESSW